MSDAAPIADQGFISAEKLRRWRRLPPAAEPLPQQFTLAALSTIFTTAAIYFGLLRVLGVLAVVLMLAALVVLHFWKVPGRWKATKQLTADMLAGIVLPLGCLLYDPGVFRTSFLRKLTIEPANFPEQIGIYTLLTAEMLLLFVWLLVGGSFIPLARSMTAGVLWVGCAVCVVLGIPLAIFGAMACCFAAEPIGLLGFVPWFTFWVFRRNARIAKSNRGDTRGSWGMCLGATLVLALAMVAGFATRLIAPQTLPIPAAELRGTFEH
jgi:hypothetical protein